MLLLLLLLSCCSCSCSFFFLFDFFRTHYAFFNNGTCNICPYLATYICVDKSSHQKKNKIRILNWICFLRSVSLFFKNFFVLKKYCLLLLFLLLPTTTMLPRFFCFIFFLLFFLLFSVFSLPTFFSMPFFLLWFVVVFSPFFLPFFGLFLRKKNMSFFHHLNSWE